jgi:peptidoglycan/xylan/chitin deacetylase (PgdA/CDA1 family)
MERAIRRLRRVKGGDIVLLHDGDRRHTVAAIEYWLSRWKDSGMRFVTLEQMREKNSAGGKIE